MKNLLTSLKRTKNELSQNLVDIITSNVALISTEVELPLERVIYLLKRRAKGKYRRDNVYWEGYKATLDSLERTQEEILITVNVYSTEDLYVTYLDSNYKFIGIIRIENNGINHLKNIKLDFHSSSLKLYEKGKLKKINELFEP